LPGLMVYGGSIMPGRFQGKDVTIGDVYEAVGRHAVGKMTDEELHELETVACPGAGACGGQFTANTMATAFEALGISPAGSSRTPLLADMKPWGRFTAVDMDRAGGIMLVLQRLAEAKVLNEHAMTVTGKMIGDEARAAKETHGQEVVRPLANPIAKSGGMMILKGSLAPDGAVMKVAGHLMKPSRFSARVFEREEDALTAVLAGRIKE